MQPNEALIKYALGFQGEPYVHAGNFPVTGFDCSGLVCYILKAGGALKYNQDMSSEMLFQHFSKPENGRRMLAGCAIALFGRGGKATHCGFTINNYQMVEAGGGDSTIRNVQTARLKGACVRLMPIDYRSDLITVIRPKYLLLGEK